MKILFRIVQCFVIWCGFTLLVSAQTQCGFTIGKAHNLPKPVYPQYVKVIEPETVVVNIEVDENGYVSLAKAVSGRADFIKDSERAALLSKFGRIFPSFGEAFVSMKVLRTLRYVFFANKSITVFDSNDFTDEELKKAGIDCEKEKRIYHLSFKADNSIMALVAGLLRNQSSLAFGKTTFVIDGKAEIGVRLNNLDNKVLRRLRLLGLEITGKITSGKAVVGRIRVEKLTDLLDFSEIVYVFPFWMKLPPRSIV